jgi:hypothetical protein
LLGNIKTKPLKTNASPQDQLVLAGGGGAFGDKITMAAGPFGGQDLSKRNKALLPSIWAVSRVAS